MACRLDIKKTILDDINTVFIEGRYTYYRLNDDTFRVANAQETKGKSRAKSLNQAREIALEVRNRIIDRYGNNVMVEIIMPEYIGFPVELKVTPSDLYIEKLYSQVTPTKRTEYVSRLAFLQDPALFQQELIEDQPLKMIPYEAWAVQNVAPNPVIDAKGNPVFDTALSENNLLAPQITGEGQLQLMFPTPIKPGVPELFESNAEFADSVYEAAGFTNKQELEKQQITPQQKQQAQQLYSQYLDSIFPDSKVKDIVYHGTDYDENSVTYKTDRGGIFLASNPIYASYFSEQENAYPALINFNNTYQVKELTDNIGKNEIGQIKSKGFDSAVGKGGISKMSQHKNDLEYIAFKPEQIHILSSKADIQGFKDFMAFKNSEFSKYGTYQQFRDFITDKSSMEIENRLIETGKIDRVC